MKQHISFRKLRLESLEAREMMAVVAGTESHVAAAALLTVETPSTHVTTCIDRMDSKDGLISLSEAINYASVGDTITFDSSLAGQTIYLDGCLGIRKGITIDASSIGGITISSESMGRAYDCFAIKNGTEQNPVKLISLTIEGTGINVLDGVTEILNCKVRKVTRDYGIQNWGATKVQNCTVSGIAGNGIVNKGKIDVINCVVKDNNGTGIYGSGTTTVRGCTISGNHGCVYYGGGIYNDGGTLTVSNSTIKGNSASSKGGALYCRGDLTLEDSLITDNSAKDGGGIYTECISATISRCVISQNTADINGGGNGGGVYNAKLLNIVNCGIWENSAQQYGGGVYSASGSSPFEIRNCTIAGNEAKYGGGFSQGKNGYITYYIYNSIIAHNEADYDGNDVLDTRSRSYLNAYNTISSYNNWTESASCYTCTSSTPLFAAGGYTLASNSMAINKGNNSYISKYGNTDLAGKTRIVNNTVDIGAYEYQSAAPTPTYNPDLAVSLSGAVTAVTNGKFTVKGATVKNNGKATAGSYTVTFYASTDSTINTSDTKLASYSFSSLGVGETSKISDKSFSVSGLTEGKTYYIGWIISGVSGETNTSNNTAKTGTIIVPVTKSPDLAVSLSGAVTAVTNGKFTVKGATVKNNGKATAGSYTVTFYASTDSTINTSDTKLASYSFSSLGVGATSKISDKSFSVSGLTEGKTYYIGWIISGVSGETNTSNNTAKTGTIIVPVTKSPDLAVSLSGAVTAVTNGRFTLKGVTVKNNGKAAAGSYTVTVYASTDSTINTSDTKLAAYSFSSLGAGASSAISDKSISVANLTPGKTYYIGWIISGVSGESNTSNNTGNSGTIIIPVTRSPDLAVSLSGAVTTVTNGKFTLKGATVKNSGNAAAGSYTVTVYASTDSTINTSDTKLAAYSFSSLGAGASSTISDKSISVANLAAGKTYYIGWIISGVSGESNTSNNTGNSGTITIPVAAPDLTVSAEGSVTAVSNGKFTLKGATVKNSGNAAADGYTVTVYASTDSTINTSDTKLASYSFSSLSAGASFTISDKSISVANLAAGKTYYIGWIISGVSGETNTSNNTALINVSPVIIAPDLTVFSTGSVSAVSNGMFTLKGAAVKNNGNAAADGYTVTVYASTDSTINTSDTKLMSFLSSSLGAGASFTISDKILSVANLAAGKTYYIGWIISGVSGETNTSNNVAKSGTITIPVAAPDLKVSDGGSVSGISNGKFTLKGTTVKNNGNAAAGGYTVTVYASTDKTINTSDTKMASYTYSSLGAGASYKIPNASIALGSLQPGKTYYIGWIISGVSGETNTSNNTGNSGKLSIPADAKPDLKARNGGTIASSTTGSFDLTLGPIENIGSKKAASGFTVKLYACTDIYFASSNTISLGTFTLSNGVNPGKSRDLTIKNIPTTKLTATASYYFKWTICNVSGETNTGNNTARTSTSFKLKKNGIMEVKAAANAAANVLNAVYADYAASDIFDLDLN